MYQSLTSQTNGIFYFISFWLARQSRPTSSRVRDYSKASEQDRELSNNNNAAFGTYDYVSPYGG